MHPLDDLWGLFHRILNVPSADYHSGVRHRERVELLLCEQANACVRSDLRALRCHDLYIVTSHAFAPPQMRIGIAKDAQCTDCFDELEAFVDDDIDGD
jgi:hypothetical protein